jgi:hypothetical protein
MLRIDFTPEDVERLDYERYHHPHPRVQRKMEVVYLKSQGVPHRDIKRIERICENTLLSYLRDYQEGGIERLSPVPYEKPSQAASCRGLLTSLVSSNNLRIVSNVRRKAPWVSSLSGTRLNS